MRFFKTRILLLFFTSLFIAISSVIYSQPSNDDCSFAIDLGILPACPSTIFTNKSATPSDIGLDNIGSCMAGIEPEQDVWFKFSPTKENQELLVSIIGEENNGFILRDILVSVYRGVCLYDAMIERNCYLGSEGSDQLVFTLKGLTQGEVYYLRIDNYNGDPSSGGFKLCIEEKYIYNIKKDNFSSKCSGILYDSGGSDGNYSNNENYTFTICPNSINKSINFEFEYYNVSLINEGQFEYDTVPDPDYHDGDVLTVYNGSDTTYVSFFEINGNADKYFEEKKVFGGGINYSYCLNSPCITINFKSDDTINSEGFKMSWSCGEEFCTGQDSLGVKVKINNNSDSIIKYLVLDDIDAKLTDIKCDIRAFGIFKNKSSEIGFDKGLVLSTGMISNAVGVNNSTKTSFAFNTQGDRDLDSLSVLTIGKDWKKSKDACVLEFDMIPFSDEISYKYVFGSEEYHEFVNNKYNDVFALFISGENINGDSLLNNKKNMALVPYSNDFVSINSVNGKNNWQYYHSNLNGSNIQYDGLVWDSLGENHYLIAKQKVIPCETYHLKYAIADRFDTIYDSGVFIGELTDGRPILSVDYSSDFKYLVDNCDAIEGELEILFASPLEKDISFEVEVTGTAVRDIDYKMKIPDLLDFKEGEFKKVFPIKVLLDNEIEGEEVIIIKLFRELNCGRKKIGEIQIDIYDELDVEINNGQDSLLLCNKNEITLYSKGTEFMHWEPSNLFVNADTNIVSFISDSSRWIYVKGRMIDTIFDKCFGQDSIFLKLNKIGIEGDTSVNICESEKLELKLNTSEGVDDIKWYKDSLLIGENEELIIESGQISGYVYAQIDFDGCVFYDSIYIDYLEKSEVQFEIDPMDEHYFGDTVIVFAEIEPDYKDSLKWSINEENKKTIENNLSLELVDTSNLIKISFLNFNNCLTSDSIYLNVDFRRLFFPNAIFLEEEINGVFKIYNSYNGLEVLSLQIFNRWGEIVFNCINKECAEKGWDGKINGVSSIPAVYLYNCIVKEPYQNNPRSIKGTFMVIK